jgi:hypothetical protein
VPDRVEDLQPVKRVKNSAKFEDAYHKFRTEYEYAYSLHLRRDADPQSLRVLPHYAGLTLVAAHQLLPIVLHDKQIPRSCAKDFEKFSQAMPKRRIPKDRAGWFVKHLAGLQLLLQSSGWPDKGTLEERLVRIGPFVVHNQTQQDDISATAKILGTAHALLRDSGVPQIEKIFYGDVYFVGQIEKNRNRMALYYPSNDTVFVLLVKRFEEEILHSLIHELGHRYYARVWSKDSKAEWAKHHRAIEREAKRTADTRLPEPGDILRVDGKDRVAGPIVTRTGNMWITLVDGGAINVLSYVRVRESVAVSRAYPTPYASKDSEEHFCEALSLFCTGELAEPHRTNFEAIVGVPPKPEPVVVPSAAPRALGPKGQIALFNPSRREAALRRRIANP